MYKKFLNCFTVMSFISMLFMVSTNVSYGQELIFSDDFSGDLSKWQELGNPGNPNIIDGQLVLEWGYDPNWFVTNDTFNFGSEGYRVDVLYAGGGHQQAENFKANNVQILFGATDPNANNGGVIATMSGTE